jgi:hypothetical protein
MTARLYDAIPPLVSPDLESCAEQLQVEQMVYLNEAKLLP